MRTDLRNQVGVVALVLALSALPAAHAREIADSDGGRRVAAAETTERHAEVLADYDAWIRRRPRDPSGYFARARLSLVLGKAGAAASDLEKAVRLKPTDAYNVLWLHFARNRESAPDVIELQANAARVNRSVWPGPVLDYVTGKTEASVVLTKAGDAQGKAKAIQLCEADLFLGQDALAEGRRSEGLERLQAAARDCEPATREARLAQAALTPVSDISSKTPPLRAGPIVRPAAVRSETPSRAQGPAAADPLGLRGRLN